MVFFKGKVSSRKAAWKAKVFFDVLMLQQSVDTTPVNGKKDEACMCSHVNERIK